MRSLTKAAAVLFLGAVLPLAAQDWLVASGFNHFYNLEYEQAIADFTAAAHENPLDASIWNHLAQAILYRAMLRSRALDTQVVVTSHSVFKHPKVEMTPTEEQSFSDTLAKALAISQVRLDKNPQDAEALYVLGTSYALRANYEFSVQRASLDALRDAGRAREAHARVCELEPDNVDARLIPGLYDYVTGSLTGGYKLLASLTGHHGDRERGIHTIEAVVRNGKSNRADAEVVLAAVYRREHRSKDAIPLVQDLIRQFPRTYLLRFELVEMFNDIGDEQSALQQLAVIWELNRTGAPGFAQLRPEKIEYVENAVLFHHEQLAHVKKAAADPQALDLTPRQETN